MAKPQKYSRSRSFMLEDFYCTVQGVLVFVCFQALPTQTERREILWKQNKRPTVRSYIQKTAARHCKVRVNIKTATCLHKPEHITFYLASDSLVWVTKAGMVDRLYTLTEVAIRTGCESPKLVHTIHFNRGCYQHGFEGPHLKEVPKIMPDVCV